MINKAYIITTPCSGKTNFIDYYEGKYGILHLFDHDDGIGVCDCSVLESFPIYSCILGGNHIPDQEKYIYGIVLIDEEQLHQQIRKRRRERKEVNTGWTEEKVFSHIDHGYYAVQQTAKEYNIPVFNTFGKALDFTIFKMIENE